MKNPSSSDHRPLPWAKMLLFVALLFFTGLLYVVQQYSSYFMGSIVGQPDFLLDQYPCPQTSATFEVSPVPALLSYTKGNTDANRRELLRINKKNHGLTAWYTYDMGFNEALKAQLIDQIAYETDPDRYLTSIYNAIKDDGSPHGAADFVTPWLSPDNPHLPTVFPYGSGYVVEVKEGSSGYGNAVSVCSDLMTASGQNLRVLYTVAHLQTISVQEGQQIGAGTQLGLIGTTGRSSTEHAHIAITPNLYWDADYRNVYNAGYNAYFPSSVRDILVKTIDPIAVMLNPDLAYALPLDEAKKQSVFQNTASYIAQINGAVVLGDNGGVLDAGGASILDEDKAPVFDGFRLSVDKTEVSAGESVIVTVEAVDQNGQRYEQYNEDVNVVLSSPTANPSGLRTLNQGLVSFTITDSTPGEVNVQVSNQGTISAETKVTFTDHLSYLEVTAPQKTTVGNAVTVALRPVGSQGGVLTDSMVASLKFFPAVNSPQEVVLSGGRGEYTFKPEQEGILELQFELDEIQERIQLVVQESDQESQQDPDSDIGTEPESDTAAQGESETETEAETATEPEPEIEPEPESESPATTSAEIRIQSGEAYQVYDREGALLIVFDDHDVQGEYPVGMQFTVPKETDAVSIFTGLNDRNFPATGELKLSKYTPGQEIVRYYPKYVPEETFKKIVAYRDGQVLAEQVFTWSPGSTHVFSDVIEGVTDDEVYRAVKALKEAGVVKGNPDGSYGVDTPINRAATATILIRAFYSNIDLDTLVATDIPFTDVPASKWYASAIWFASQDEYQGQSKPVIIKGYQGKANPDGNVKIEEFVTMLLRLLEVPLEDSQPWYESAISTSIELGLMTEAERSLIDQPLPRGLVARIMVEALELAQELAEDPDRFAAPEEEIVVEDEAEAEAEAETEEEADVLTGGQTTLPEPVSKLQYEMRSEGLLLSWVAVEPGPYRIYRETLSSGKAISIGSTNGTSFTDISAKAGEQYYYRVETDATGSTVGSTEILAQL